VLHEAVVGRRRDTCLEEVSGKKIVHRLGGSNVSKVANWEREKGWPE